MLAEHFHVVSCFSQSRSELIWLGPQSVVRYRAAIEMVSSGLLEKQGDVSDMPWGLIRFQVRSEPKKHCD